MSPPRLPLFLLAAYGLIALGEGASSALDSGVGTDLSRAVITVAGVLWLLHGLRRAQAWAWWLATGGATVFLISVSTALVMAGLAGQPAKLPPSLYAKSALLLGVACLLLLPASRRRYLGRRDAAS
ncbi:hypothetical protein [Immundisolibacter cernigliae]|uniref:Uncharacterized protein n=1 Tax=Immundisolibacter cernigliae TaxID=1810504 RepID=A0A1B1YUB5_9GAMM|nr:hypothetical protein [Immundisolibacter cernigliae]ANX04401.1 hypothetical protein PG2T_09570 [Immundisolibacter cernigliae]